MKKEIIELKMTNEVNDQKLNKILTEVDSVKKLYDNHFKKEEKIN